MSCPRLGEECYEYMCSSCRNGHCTHGRTSNKFESLRLSTGLTRAQFSDLLHIPVRTISAWETGYREPAPYVYELIKIVIDKARI